ncbi:MAG: acetyl-CoA carboxylase biotin carboxyl carrier protein [Candidatus Aminicenantes bacterium]|nr:acetyl-CoA carboxylase biotin carboxyl carrier protein [Candidatus Aminicenantes bacterium]
MKEKIDYKEIKKLIDFMEEKNLSQFELEVEGFKIKFGKNQQPVLPTGSVQQVVSSPESDGSSAQASDQTEEKDKRYFIFSPMVGTFFRSPDPSSPPFADIGERIKKNQTLCIIEAMKLMNEIESDIEGIIDEIFVEDGNPIEYGQRLFAIKVQ